jgi:hypothetical protein
MVYFTTVGSNGRILANYEVYRALKGSGRILIDVLSRKIPGETEVKHEKSQADWCPDRYMKQAPNECSQKCYHVSQLFLPLTLYLILYII